MFEMNIFLSRITCSMMNLAVIIILFRNQPYSLKHYLLSAFLIFVPQYIVVYLTHTTNINFLFIIFINIAICYFIFNESIFKGFIVYIINVIIQLVAEKISMVICHLIFQKTTEDIFFGDSIYDLYIIYLIVTIIFIICLVILNNVVSKRQKSSIDNHLITLIFSFTATTFYAIFYCQMFPETFFINSIILVLILGLIFYSIYDIYTKQKQQALLELQINRLSSLIESNEETKRVNQDIVDHLYMMQSFLNNKDKAKTYMTSLIEKYNNIQKKYCQNVLVDSILSHKFISLKKIKIYTDIQIPYQLNIKDVDLATVLFNTIDNAIESCQRNEDNENYISVDMKINANYLLIHIENSKNPLEVNESISIKEEKNHGYGLSNVRDVIKKYNGTLKTMNHLDKYETTVLLQLKEA